MTRWQGVVLAIVSAVAGALIAVVFLHRAAAREPDGETKAEAAAPAETVSMVGGETVVTIDAATAARNHVAVSALAAARQSEASRAYATAVDVRDLVDARNQLATARAQSEQARAHLAAVDAEVARLRVLHDDNRNISDRVLQEAEANERAERANADAAAAAARAAEGGVRQRWGDAVARAFGGGARWIDDLTANRSVLVQVVAPAQPPERISLQTPDGNAVTATFVSPSPRSDPRVQGRSWLYLAPAGAIAPGMSLTALVGSGESGGGSTTPDSPLPTRSGVLVPRDAVVWTGGRAWVYVERAPNQYARRSIDATVPMGDGYFVATLTPGTRVVTDGAQQLLSEENKPKVEE